MSDEDLESTLVDLRTKTVIFLDGDDEGNMRCVEQRAVKAIADGKKTTDALRIEVFRAGMRNSWAEINAKHKAELEADDSTLVLPALEALRLHSPERVLPRIFGLLKSPDVGIRMTGAELAGEAGLKEHIPRIIELFATESGIQVDRYEEALLALDAGEAIKKYILSKDAKVGQMVPLMARSLASDPDLLDLASHPDPGVRRNVMRFLGVEWRKDGAQKSDPETVIKTLVLAASDPVEKVAESAARRLDKYTEPESRQKLVSKLLKKKDKALSLGLCIALYKGVSSKKHFKKFARSSNEAVKDCGKRALEKIEENREDDYFD